MRIAHLSDLVRVGVGAFAGASLLFTASGCLATRSWVDDQLRPITGQQQQLESQMNNLHLERRLVLDSTAGPTFTTGSAALSSNAKREIDSFLGDQKDRLSPAQRRRGASSWSPAIPTASAMTTTTTSSDTGAPRASLDI